MAKKMTDDEIESFIKSKQVSAQDYVAPTVITGGRNQSRPTQQRTVKQSTQQTAKPTISIGMNGALQNAANKSGISFLSNAYQNIANNKVNNLVNTASGAGNILNNVKNSLVNNAKNIVKSGDSNVGMGLLNTGLDALSHYGQGWFRTLEGQADTGLYMLADQHKANSALANKLLGEGNFISGINDFLGQGYMDTAKHNSTGDIFGTDGQNSLLENVAWLGSDFQKNLAKTTYDVTGNKDLANVFNAKSKALYDLSQLGENGENWRSRVKDSSYLGTTGANVAEGLGNITAMAMEAAVGSQLLGMAGMTTVNPATGATELSTAGKTLMTFTNSFTSSYGNTRSTAYEQGVDDRTARRAATINGLAEGLSELMFDAMPGIKSPGFLDKVGVKDILTDRLSKTFGKGVGKVFLKLAGGTEEGFEEMMSNALVALGTDLMHYIDNNYTYGMENLSGNAVDDFFGQLLSQESIDSFVTSALTSTLLSAGGDVLTTHQQNQIIGEYAKQNNITVNEAKQQLFSETNLQQALEQVKDAHNTVEQEGQARQNILNNVKANNYQQVVQPTQETQQPVIETETPQIQTKQETNINTQETPQSVDTSLKPTKTRTQSIIDSVNAFNLKKQEQVQQQNQQQEVKTTETQGLNDNEYNEIKKRYKSLMEEIGFEEDYNKNATPSEILGQLKTIKETAFEGDGFLESARMEGDEVLKQTRAQYDKINRLINRFENKVKIEQQEVKTPTKPKGKAMTLQELQNRLGVKETKQQKIENNAKALNLEENKKVEKNAKMVYNEAANEKGVGENEFRRLQKESRNLSKEQHETLYGGDKSGIKRVRENISRVLQPKMESIISSNNDNGKSIKNGYVETSNKDFHDIFELNQPYLRNPDTVTVYEAKDYKNNKNYLSEDGLSGFSITPDGDLISVFNNSGKPGMLLRISDLVKENAKTLDCFQNNQQKLADMYEDAFGFKTASIMDFNYDILAEEHGKEYADAFVEKYGEAPVHFMVKTNQEIETKHFNKDQYDEALEYRNSLIDKQGTIASSFSNAQKEQTKNIAEKKQDEEIILKNNKIVKDSKNIDTEDTGIKIGDKPVKKAKDKNTHKNSIGKDVPNDGVAKQINQNLEDIKNGKIGTSKFYENITQRSEFLTKENRQKLSKEADLAFYNKVTNKESLDKAYDLLNKNAEGAVADFFSNNERFDSTTTAMGWILLKQAQDAGDYTMMYQVAKKMRENGTAAGQAIQAYNIMARLTPEGMYEFANRELIEAQERFEKGKSKKWIEQNKDRWQLTTEETKDLINTMKKVEKMPDGRSKAIELGKIQKMLQDKLPAERGQAIKSWMRISMLLNPKTQVRNVFGNVLIRPVNDVADFVGSLADFAISKKTGVRTKGNLNLKAQIEGAKTKAKTTIEDYRLGINTSDLDGNRFEIKQGKAFNENHTGALAKPRNILSKVGNTLNDFTSFLLELGDEPFKGATYEQALQNQMALNNVSEATQDMLDIAEQESLERTWQDDNKYTKFVLDVRKALNEANIKGYGLGDVLIPFAKTPANLTKAIVDYSPAGYVGAITKGINLKNALDTGQFTPIMQHQFVNQLGKATAGTMLYILGSALAKAKITTGSADDDKDVADFMRNTLGIQPYSIVINGKSYTYDWAQPVAAPFAITADIEKNMQAAKDGELTLDKLIKNTFGTASNVLLEQSFLEGIKDVFGGYGDPVDNLIEEINGLPARAIPTFFQQIATLVDGKQRMSYGDSETPSIMSQAQSKVPGLASDLPVKRNTLGKEVERYGGKNNIFNVFFNPANYSEGKVTPGAEEIYRVYQATNDKTILPRTVSSQLRNEDGTALTNQQKSDFLKISGEIIDENVQKLLNDKNYKNLSDGQKAKVIKYIVDYAYNKAREEITGHEMSGTKTLNKALNNGYALYEYYAEKVNKEK